MSGPANNDSTPLAKALKECGLNQREFANHLDTGETQISRWVAGTTPSRLWRREIVRILKKVGCEATEVELWPDLRKKEEEAA